ncbi:hypothetical protein WOLCODRAFT_148351 [Wolfiporia cocos MD-104 SS10]|uniref:Copper transporter n=1 Tax=Wolfiporia cocos (strain MD-104) TaxID=742152 RepID=A0A2H3JE95_WOLCO|nr:hypothetical protein WOLCODRAFT_148351 [Wolfiporia cocos MD-104 SS10]
MKMDGSGWKDHLHFAFLGEHVLLPNLHIDSLWKFLVASILAICVCSSERLLTYALSKYWDPLGTRRSRARNALWRAGLYWVVTFDRLMYMLIAMTFNVGLIMVTVTTLSIGQFIIEFKDNPCSRHPPDPEYTRQKEPLLSPRPHTPTSAAAYPPPLPRRSPPRRTRSKPHDIYIHPSNSNIARAEAAAQELGLSALTLTSGSGSDFLGEEYTADEAGDGWEPGKGKDVARALLGR